MTILPQSSGAHSAPTSTDALLGKIRGSRSLLIAAAVVVILIAASVALWHHHTSSINARWNRAADDFGRADYAKASKEMKGMAMPTSTQRLRIYAQTNLATHDLNKALPAYQKLYATSKDPSVELIVGNIYSEQKNYAQAINIYQQSITNNPSNAQAYVNLSTLYKMQGNASQAVATANEGVKNNPGSATLHELQVSMLLENKDSQDYKDAIASLKQLNPNDPLLESLK